MLVLYSVSVKLKGGGGCGHMALAFKNMWPDLRIGADVDNKDNLLRPGMYVEVELAPPAEAGPPPPKNPPGTTATAGKAASPDTKGPLASAKKPAAVKETP
mgnify:CR=1 FL=1